MPSTTAYLFVGLIAALVTFVTLLTMRETAARPTTRRGTPARV